MHVFFIQRAEKELSASIEYYEDLKRDFFFVPTLKVGMATSILCHVGYTLPRSAWNELKADAVEGDGALGDEVGDLLGVDGDGVFGGVLAPLDVADGADGVHVSLDDVPMVPLLGGSLGRHPCYNRSNI